MGTPGKRVGWGTGLAGSNPALSATASDPWLNFLFAIVTIL